MKVKEVIISALKILGRTDIAEALSAGGQLSREESETVETLLYCFNAVEDEVARKYVPLYFKEELDSPDGEYFYESFMYAPINVSRVLVDGEEVEFEIFPFYMVTNSKKITVEYRYAPAKKKIEGWSDFGGEVGEYLLAFGTASEYCLINGEVEAAELWEKKYRSEIDLAQKKLHACKNIPPRRWV